MPKYKVEWDLGDQKVRLGTLTFNDDEAAVLEVTVVCRREGLGATITRPDRKLTVASIPRPSVGQRPVADVCFFKQD